jgi:pyrimidine deaminase RibD-like protein
VRNNVVCSAAFCTLAIIRALVSIVWVGVLQDNVPCVKKSREDAEAAECNVDERICAANTALNPHYRPY